MIFPLDPDFISTDRIIKASEEEVLLELYKKKKEDILIRIAIQD